MTSTFADLFAYLSELMTRHGDFFAGMGLNMFRGFALILMVWFGVKTALASTGGHGAFGSITSPNSSLRSPLG